MTSRDVAAIALIAVTLAWMVAFATLAWTLR